MPMTFDTGAGFLNMLHTLAQFAIYAPAFFFSHRIQAG